MGDDSRTIDTPTEREKWEFEKDIRRREIACREGELLRAKRGSPLVIAIFTAAAAGLVNLGVTWSNGQNQTKLETVRAEQALVLESIKTDGDVNKSSKNLQFLIDTKLLTDENRRDAISKYLANPKNVPPSLASTNVASAASTTPATGRYDFPVQNVGSINVQGWDVDIFACGTDPTNNSRASRFAAQLARSADHGQRVGGQALGRVRLTSGKQWEQANVVVADVNEMDFARSLAALATEATPPFTVKENSEARTSFYVSVFFCSG